MTNTRMMPATPSDVVDVLIRRLEAFSPIGREDAAFLADAIPPGIFVPADTILVAEGDLPKHVHLVVSGIACRCKEIGRARRQITGYLLPGDFCDLHVFMLDRMDHTILTLTDSMVVRVPRQRVLDLIAQPALSRALLFSSLVDASISREWITNVGQRTAMERLAHHFCEIFMRMKLVGLTVGDSYRLPITQSELADTVGLSLVHTNKSLRTLTKAGLLQFRQGVVEILDPERLRSLCGFNDFYLHMANKDRSNIS